MALVNTALNRIVVAIEATRDRYERERELEPKRERGRERERERERARDRGRERARERERERVRQPSSWPTKRSAAGTSLHS